MNAPNQHHIAGLRLALAEADTVSTDSISVAELESLIAQASAAPEQEPFGYMRPEGVELVQRGDYGSVHHKVDGYHTIPVFTHADPSEVERLRAALQHIIKAVGQSRSSTRRLRWIEQRAVWALEGREYDNSQFDLPKNAGNTAERATQEAARLRAENKRLDLALAQADHNYDCDRQQFEQKLAEAQALLRDARDLCNAVVKLGGNKVGPIYSHAIHLSHRIAALSATAQPAECDHQWTDDGEHLLICTECGAQEDHDPKWRDMDTAPRDGTLLRLLVEFTDHATEDADQAPTIGANNFDNDGEDRWQFAGWCWTHDHFTEGKGEPVGWLPMLDGPKRIQPTEVKS